MRVGKVQSEGLIADKIDGDVTRMIATARSMFDTGP